MEDHGRVTQQGAEAVPIREGKRETGEGVGDEGHECDEEGLGPHQGNDDVGHQLPVTVPVLEDNGAGVEGEEQRPEEERALLPTPQGGDEEVAREGPAGVLDHVAELEVVGPEGVQQGQGGQGQQPANGQNALLGAGHQLRVATPRPHDGGGDGVDGEWQGQHQGGIADVCPHLQKTCHRRIEGSAIAMVSPPLLFGHRFTLGVWTNPRRQSETRFLVSLIPKIPTTADVFSTPTDILSGKTWFLSFCPKSIYTDEHRFFSREGSVSICVHLCPP